MEIKNYFAQDASGNVMPGARVDVFFPNTTSPVGTLQNAEGGAKSNPFFADVKGLIQFAAPNGLYDLKVTSGMTSYTIRIQCADLADSVAEAEAAVTAAQEAADSAIGQEALAAAQVTLAAANADRAETARDEAVAAASASVLDPLRRSVEAASGGRMTVLYTANGAPCHMHVFPAFNLQDVAPGGELGTGLHPAFLFDGQPATEIFVGAYQASMMGTEAVSLPGADPRTSVNHDVARNLCKANGPGWDLMSNLDWAAVAIWCMANGFEPRGNTNQGRHHTNRIETGRRVDGLAPGATGTARTRTGSGPQQWAHDGSPAGIHDLVGNVWEWVSGMKLIDGRVWLAPDNGLNEETSYINTGFNLPSQRTWSTVDATAASALVKQSLIAPATPALSPIGTLYTDLTAERLPCRGGGWNRAGNAGLAALNLTYARTFSYTLIGFRPRFRAQ